MSNTEEKKHKSVVTGVVISDKMKDSAVVRVDRKVKDPIYGKYVRRSTKLHVHDHENQTQVGDMVLIKECRPYSKTKNWELVKILEKAQ